MTLEHEVNECEQGGKYYRATQSEVQQSVDLLTPEQAKRVLVRMVSVGNLSTLAVAIGSVLWEGREAK